MIFFFGTRATAISRMRLNNTTCPYCDTQNSFTVTSFGKYAHFFWIPMFPYAKVHVAECGHCKRTYAQHEFTDQMRTSFANAQETQPVKRPIWHGIGCLLVLAFTALFTVLSVIGGVSSSGDDDAPIDPRKELLDKDIAKMTRSVSQETDSISWLVKTCLDYSLEDQLKMDEIRYYSRLENRKLLILLEVRDMKKIRASSRKELISAIEDCIDIMEWDSFSETYIGVEGKYNTILIKTPSDSDLGGRYADKEKLLPFYDTLLEEEDVIIESVEIDSTNVSN